MPTEFFTVEPSADIYLSMADNPNVTLRLWVSDCAAAPAYLNFPHPDITFAQSNFFVIDTVLADGIIKAKSAGTAFVRITLNDTVNALFHELVVRVSVFPSFSDVWLGGNGKATVHDGWDDLVISVYARSPAGDVADITGHGFMRFTSLDQSIAAVYPDTGRVIGVGLGTATIRGQYRGQQYDTAVDVIPDFTRPREIVEKVWYSGAGPERKNFLFLAEGFTEDERGKFERIVRRIASRMRRSRAHEPYRLLKDRYNIWMAFEASQESGVSVGPLIDSNTGKDPRISQGNPPQRIHQPLQVRASRLGLMYGRRMGDRYSQVFPARASLQMDASWYTPLDPLSFFANDPRRTPTNTETWKPSMFAFLNSLRTTEGNTDLNYNIGQKWNLDSADQGHVIVIVNDDHLGGNYLISATPGGVMYLWGVVSINQKLKFNLVQTDHPGIDHRPGNTSSLREPTVAVAVHELSHSFFLGDEYEGANPFPGSDPAIAQIEWSYNITTGHLVVAGGITYIKWAELKRMERSSAVLRDAPGAAGGSIMVDLFPGEGAKWAAGPDTCYLRTVNCNQGSHLPTSLSMCTAPQPIHQLYPARHRHEPKEYLVTVTDVRGDRVTLAEAPGSPSSIGPGTVIPARSVLFAAKKHDGQELGLVLPGTLDVLTGNRGLGGAPAPGVPAALLDKGAVCVENKEVSYPPAGIPDITYPKRWETLIGLYEGAGGYNCDVYRSSGTSKMRDEYNTGKVIKFVQNIRLDHLGKYVIVNQVDPSRHEMLDQDYPGEPA